MLELGMGKLLELEDAVFDAVLDTVLDALVVDESATNVVDVLGELLASLLIDEAEVLDEADRELELVCPLEDDALLVVEL